MLKLELMEAPDRFIAYPTLLFGSWIVVWSINVALRSRFHWDTETDTIYWIAMKVIVWVLPVLVAIRELERASIAQFLELRHAVRGVLWADPLYERSDDNSVQQHQAPRGRVPCRSRWVSEVCKA